MEQNKLIELLNEALQNEYTDIFLYPRRAELVKNKEISEMFEKFGRMELRHADNIGSQILAFGGQPKWLFTPPDSKEAVNEILYDHLERERESVRQYSFLIEQLNDEDEAQLKLVLRGIKAEEEEHLAVIKRLYKNHANTTPEEIP